MFRFFLVLTLMSAPFAAAADGHERLKAMKQICEDDASVGFDWENGRYKQVNFREKKFTLTRIDPLNYGDNLSKEEKEEIEYHCILPVDTKEEFKSENFYSYNTCLRFSEFGGGSPRYFTCKEYHNKKEEPKSWEISFSCNMWSTARVFDFTPNEFFHRRFFHRDTSAKLDSSPDGKNKGYKDSLSLSVGRCSSILE